MAIASGLLKAFETRRPTFTPESQLPFLHAAARTCGWRLGPMNENNGVMRSYTWVGATCRDEALSILLENEGRAAGFATGFPPVRNGLYGDYVFADKPDFVHAMAQLNSPVPFLTGDELRQEIFEDDRAFLRQANRAMTADLAYWRPETVGAVIFNFWD